MLTIKGIDDICEQAEHNNPPRYTCYENRLYEFKEACVEILGAVADGTCKHPEHAASALLDLIDSLGL